MSEEEKKAIDNFKRLDFFEYDWEIRDDDFETRDEMLAHAEKMQKIILNLIDKQQNEIEEKSTILLAGAEKVKQLEKEIKELKEKIVDLKTKLAIEKIDNKYNQEERDEETIPRYKIIDILNYLNDTELNNYEIVIAFKKMMKELLEEAGDHIPRID